MDFNISGIKETILVGFQYAAENGLAGYQYAVEKGSIGYQYASENGGVLAKHTVTVLKQGLEFIREDARAAAACFALLNPLFLHIALRITTLVSFGQDKLWKNLCNLTVTASLLVGMNAALAKALQSPLTAGQIALVSVASCASYVMFRIWLANRTA